MGDLQVDPWSIAVSAGWPSIVPAASSIDEESSPSPTTSRVN
jgi:hypothetical protein